VAGSLLLAEADGEGPRVSGGLKRISPKSLASGLTELNLGWCCARLQRQQGGARGQRRGERVQEWPRKLHRAASERTEAAWRT
jgi:hypothetical protein